MYDYCTYYVLTYSTSILNVRLLHILPTHVLNYHCIRRNVSRSSELLYFEYSNLTFIHHTASTMIIVTPVTRSTRKTLLLKVILLLTVETRALNQIVTVLQMVRVANNERRYWSGAPISHQVLEERDQVLHFYTYHIHSKTHHTTTIQSKSIYFPHCVLFLFSAYPTSLSNQE